MKVPVQDKMTFKWSAREVHGVDFIITCIRYVQGQRHWTGDTEDIKLQAVLDYLKGGIELKSSLQVKLNLDEQREQEIYNVNYIIMSIEWVQRNRTGTPDDECRMLQEALDYLKEGRE